MITTGLDVVALDRREQFERYAAFAAEVYEGNPHWVPPDPHHFIASLAGEVLAAAHCELQPFWVAAGGRVLATATALIDRLYNEHWGDTLGHVFFFEALPGEDAAATAVLQAACDWLQQRGCGAARLSFLYGWQLPLTIDAYDEPPTIFHTYNPPFYHRLIKNAGFATESGQIEFRVRFTPELQRRYEEMASRAAGLGVSMRAWDLSQPGREAARWAQSYNDAFAAHWGAARFPQAEFESMISGLAEVMVPEFTVFAEAEGHVVGSVFSLPDLHQLQRSGSVDHGVLLVIGVAPAFRGRGLNLAMAARSYLAMMARGYRSASYTTVVDENAASRRTAEKLGARVARNFVVYRRNFQR